MINSYVGISKYFKSNMMNSVTGIHTTRTQYMNYNEFLFINSF